MSDFYGQASAIRAATIAAAGGFSILLRGPVGCGRTMLGRRITGLLPSMTWADQVAVTATVMRAGLANERQMLGGLVTERAFRAPHHTVSKQGLTGARGIPGEIDLAEHGALLLDELEEFGKEALDVVKELSAAFTDPARSRRPTPAVLVAAVSPCPCGRLGSNRSCACPPNVLARHQARVRLLSESFTLKVDMEAAEEARSKPRSETSATLAEGVQAAHHAAGLRNQRIGRSPRTLTGRLSDNEITAVVGFNRDPNHARVARTIADMRGSQEIESMDWDEAATLCGPAA